MVVLIIIRLYLSLLNGRPRWITVRLSHGTASFFNQICLYILSGPVACLRSLDIRHDDSNLVMPIIDPTWGPIKTDFFPVSSIFLTIACFTRGNSWCSGGLINLLLIWFLEAAKRCRASKVNISFFFCKISHPKPQSCSQILFHLHLVVLLLPTALILVLVWV